MYLDSAISNIVNVLNSLILRLIVRYLFTRAREHTGKERTKRILLSVVGVAENYINLRRTINGTLYDNSISVLFRTPWLMSLSLVKDL